MNLITKGVDLDRVRRFLGHASIATTHCTYERARDQDRLGEELTVKDGLFEEEEEGVSPVVEAEFKEKEQFKTNA